MQRISSVSAYKLNKTQSGVGITTTSFLSSLSNPFILRAMVFTSLAAVILIIGTVSYFVLQEKQQESFDRGFAIATDQIFDSTSQKMQRISQTAKLMAQMHEFEFPTANQWPNAALTGFNTIATTVTRQIELNSLAYIPFVDPSEQASFETFAYDYYDSSPYHSNTTGVSSFGQGIYAFGGPNFPSPDRRYHDVTGFTYWGSPNRVLAPLFLGMNDEGASLTLEMFNMHSVPSFGRMIDDMLACGQKRAIGASFQSDCGIVSDMILTQQLVNEDIITQPESSSMVSYPIFPVNNATKIVGCIGIEVRWGNILTKNLPKDFDGITIVVKTKNTAYTYITKGNRAQFLGEGELYDHFYKSYRRSTTILEEETESSSVSSYTIECYPNSAFGDSYFTDLPIIACVCSIAMIFFCGLIFVMYDLAMKREVFASYEILENKRRFVRFVSHEVRTPLNAILMGAQLIESEYDTFMRTFEQRFGSVDGYQDILSFLKESMQLNDEIVTNTESAVTVLTDLLQYDKLELGTFELDLDLIDMQQVLKDACSAFNSAAKRKHIDLSLKVEKPCHSANDTIEEGEIVVLGDSGRLGQVFRNLVSNAMKFTPQGGAITIIAVLKGADTASTSIDGLLTNGTVAISILDSGFGMTPAQLQELFGEGVQFNVNKLQSGHGSGLGLHIAKGIVELHGGEITVTSDGLGKGSCFTVMLPLGQRPAVESSLIEELKSSLSADVESVRVSKPIAQHFEASDTNSVYVYEVEGSNSQRVVNFTMERQHTVAKIVQFHSNRKLELPSDKSVDVVDPLCVLVADDALSNRKLLIRMMSKKGHCCDEAENGEIAIDKYKEGTSSGQYYDAILLDYEMPVLNGPDAAKKLRRLGYKGVILGVTGNVLPSDIQYFKDHGADDVLCKPFRMEEFLKLYRHCLGPKKI